MIIDPICEPHKALGYSWWPWEWPHWWLSLTASDQGAWAAGIGALAAAGAALLVWWLSYSTARAEALRRQTQRAKLLAIETAQFLVPLNQEIKAARYAAENPFLYFGAGNASLLPKALQLTSADFLPNGLALEYLPPDLALRMAELAFFTGSYNRVVRELKIMDDADSETIRSFEKLDLISPLDQCQAALDKVAEDLSEYIPALATMDFSASVVT